MTKYYGVPARAINVVPFAILYKLDGKQWQYVDKNSLEWMDFSGLYDSDIRTFIELDLNTKYQFNYKEDTMKWQHTRLALTKLGALIL